MSARPHIYHNNPTLQSLAEQAYAARDGDTLHTILDELGIRQSALAGRVRRRVAELSGQLHAEVKREEPQLFGKFRVLERLPTSAGCEAYKVQDPTGTPRFLKLARVYGGRLPAVFQRELSIYEKLQDAAGDAVLRVIGRFKAADAEGFATEYADGGTLAEYVSAQPDGVLPSEEALVIALQLLDALSALHAVGVVHRDVKPENIVRVGDHWKFVDFGISKDVGAGVQTHTLQGMGTLGYSPPEQWLGVEAGESADVYGFGKVLVYMLRGETDPDLLALSGWWSLVKSCTERDRSTRATLKTARSYLGSI